MCAVIRKCSTGLMCHGMYDTKQCIGKCHTSKTLCIMHVISLFHIPVIRSYQITLDHLDCMQGKRICEITVRCRYICLDCMCHRIHSGMCYQFLWHCLCKFRINDCNIRCDLKVSDRIFDTFLIIGDDGKCSYLCCSSRS